MEWGGGPIPIRVTRAPPQEIMKGGKGIKASY